MFESEVKLEFFKENGFIRRVCKACGTPFWTIKADEEYCGVAPCVEYGFIDNPITTRKYDIDEMRNAYITFFSERGHTPLKRYPVVARWRDDIYFTIASIADFQPHVTSGYVEPPANPLVISQPCIRFVDVDNVGRSGRHLTVFEMMGHHAFNSPQKEIYWKNETVEYCHTFLTDILGIRSECIRYREDPWVGGGNAGPALEVCTSGLEVATLVFMEYKEDPNGSIEIKGKRFVPMAMRVVDPGYGLERLVWASKGTFTVYDAIYPDIIKGIAKYLDVERNPEIMTEYFKIVGLFDLEGRGDIRTMRLEALERLRSKGIDISYNDLEALIAPWESIYALADHAKALMFMIGDGAVPSNTKGGYLVRLLIRRALRILEDLCLKDITLGDIVDMHIDALSDTYREFLDVRETIHNILDIESERYRKTMAKAVPRIKGLIERYRGNAIPTNEVLLLYESHGIHPSAIRSIASEMGIDISIPENITSILAERHTETTKIIDNDLKKQDLLVDLEDIVRKTADIKDTGLLYYTEPKTLEFESVVCYIQRIGDLQGVILEETAFYPEGGGQPCDLGRIICDGKEYPVKDVRKVGGKVVHLLDCPEDAIEVGMRVKGIVDKDRRMAHTRHHTATHLIINAARRILGPHVWQTGSQLWQDFARLDITHYQRPTEQEIMEIEKVANTLVFEGHKVTKIFMPRDLAEKKYGFVIYQGGPPISKILRIVNIDDIEVEACGGTHVDNTYEIGLIKIKGCERIQDGVVRLEFTAGMATLDYIHGIENLIKEAAKVFNVPLEQLPSTANRFLREWKLYKRQVEALKSYEAKAKLETMMRNAERIRVDDREIMLIHSVLDGTIADAKKITEEISKSKGSIALLGLRDEKGPKLIFARSPDIENLDLRVVIKAVARYIDGSGGGKSDFVQGGGKKVEGLEMAIAQAVKKTKEILKGT